MLLSLLVTASVLFLLFPYFSRLTARAVREAPWQVLGLGFAVLASVSALVAFALLLFGLGALTRALWRRYTSG